MELIRERVSPAAVAIGEPINLDLTNEVMSKPRGNIAYSHNYPYIFKQCNYHVFLEQVEHIDPNIAFYDTVIMLTTTSPEAV